MNNPKKTALKFLANVPQENNRDDKHRVGKRHLEAAFAHIAGIQSGI